MSEEHPHLDTPGGGKPEKITFRLESGESVEVEFSQTQRERCAAAAMEQGGMDEFPSPYLLEKHGITKAEYATFVMDRHDKDKTRAENRALLEQWLLEPQPESPSGD
jgi:hypothetical protein